MDDRWVVLGIVAVVISLLGRAFWLYLSRDDSKAEEEERKSRERGEGW